MASAPWPAGLARTDPDLAMSVSRPIRLPHRHGFSLAELLAVLVIGAVLTLLAAPTWQQHAERGWRIRARTEMVAAMLMLERHALITLSFASAPGSATPYGEWPRAVPAPPARTRHWLTATSCGDIDLSRCVEVRATPVRADALCGTLLLRSSGEWRSLPASGGPAVPLPPEC